MESRVEYNNTRLKSIMQLCSHQAINMFTYIWYHKTIHFTQTKLFYYACSTCLRRVWWRKCIAFGNLQCQYYNEICIWFQGKDEGFLPMARTSIYKSHIILYFYIHSFHLRFNRFVFHLQSWVRSPKNQKGLCDAYFFSEHAIST